jgi:pyruvate,water dikinase
MPKASPCAALSHVREEMGLTNLRLMVPFCRRVVEAESVLKVMAQHGLGRGQNGLEIYMMCEIPNNVIQVDAFAAIFDGFSIGSNDLTQLTLGVDRDSEIVAFDFDERDPGMLEMLRLAVAGPKRMSARRHLWWGPLELSGDRSISHRPGHRLDQCQSIKPRTHHRRGA